MVVLASDSALEIIDVTDPAKPTSLQQVAFELNGDLLVGGEFERVSLRRILGFQVVDHLACVVHGELGLEAVDLSNLAKPTRVGAYDTWFALSVFVAGNFAYIADQYAGLIILDVSNPTQPVPVGKYGGNGPFDGVYSIHVVENQAFLTCNAGFQILDVRNRAQPLKTGALDCLKRISEGGCVNGFEGIQFVGRLVYIADPTSGLHILDISGASPVRLGGYDPRGSAEDVQIAVSCALECLPKIISEMVGQTCRFAATTRRSSPTISEMIFGNCYSLC